MEIFSGARFSSTFFDDGALLIVDRGGTDSGGIFSDGSEVVRGLDVAANIQSGGTSFVSSGGIAGSATIGGGGKQKISAFGKAISTTINPNAEQDVLIGGTTSRTAINGGQQLLIGGGANSTTVNGGFQQTPLRSSVATSRRVSLPPAWAPSPL